MATARTNGGRGTWQYKAPELFRTQKMGGARYDKPADMFSFAMLVWETFTGEIPWGGMPEVRTRTRMAAGHWTQEGWAQEDRHAARLIRDRNASCCFMSSSSIQCS